MPLWQKVSHASSALFTIPLCFLGIGIQRAWSSFLFNPFLGEFNGQMLYALGLLGLSCTSGILAFAAPKISPLSSSKRIVYFATAVTVVGTVLMLLPFKGSVLVLGIGMLAALGGTGVSMLVWCEFFARLNPSRVALVYSVAVVFGELIYYFLSDSTVERIWPLLVAAPIINTYFALKSIAKVEGKDVGWSGVKYTVPIQPVILMSAISFAGGFVSVSQSGNELVGLVSLSATPVIIIIAALFSLQKIQLDSIYIVAIPVVIIATALMPFMDESALPVAPVFNEMVFAFSDTTLAIMTMVVFSSISFRYGVDSLRMNGIERSVRFMLFSIGWAMGSALQSFDSGTAGLVEKVTMCLIAAVCLAVFLKNRHVFSRWGIYLNRDEEAGKGSIALRSVVCEELGDAHSLTAREREVLLLLASERKNDEIAEALFIAPGTLKSHTSHIYTKLSVHSREELLDLIREKEALLL